MYFPAAQATHSAAFEVAFTTLVYPAKHRRRGPDVGNDGTATSDVLGNMTNV